MIIAKLSGGLGNQLFQYAAGRALAIQNKVGLGLDISFYIKSPNRKYELDDFLIEADILSEKEIKAIFNIKRGFIDSFFQNRKNEIKAIKSLTYQEIQFNFDPAFFTLKDKVIIDGYWQSERYFANYRDQIKSEFKQKVVLDIDPEYLMILENNTTVALHLRRGDFIANQEINKIHGICSDQYYLNSIKSLHESFPDFTTLIFTDDIFEGNRMSSLIENSIVVKTNSSKATNHDFLLMQRCNHNIIANSTFSWWAAWLNENKNKIVIAPLKWFADESKNTSDLYPENWRVL